MPLYESTLIVRQDVSTQEVQKLTDNFIKITEEYNGKVVKTEQWGLRDLAYPIKKCNKGHYVFMAIDANTDALAEIERKAKLDENVIRYLAFRVDKIDKEPSALILQDNSGEEIVIGGGKKNVLSSRGEQ